MAITSSTTTAIDVPTLVSQLMAVERRPIDKLNARITGFEAKISSYGTLSSLVSSFQSASRNISTTLQKLAATPSDASLFSASAGSTAVPGTYTLNVSRLAQAQNLIATGQTSSTATIGNGAATTVTFDLGTISGGTLANGKYTGAAYTSNGSGTVSITIDGSNNTLEGIRDAINNSASNTSTGATATVINVDDGAGGTVSKLVLTSKSTGTTNALTVSNVSGTVATALNMATVTGYTAKDAIFSVDGYTVTRASNTVTDALQGMTLTLKAAGSTTLTVANDTATVKKNVQAMVDAYNKLNTTLADLRKGSLKADNTLISIDTQIRNVINTPPTGLVSSVDSLAEAGIKTNRDGSMSLDTSVLDAALAADFTGVAQLFANDNQGYAFRLKDLADDFLNISTGLVKARTDGLDARIKSLKTDRENYEYRLSIIENRYRKQFTTLDALKYLKKMK